MLAVALVMVYRAWSGDVDRSLDPSAMSRLARRLAGALARVGLAARAVMLGTVGVFLLLAALHHDAAHAQAIAGTFRGVRYAEYGQAVLGLLALGFIANGLVELLRARFRRQRIDA